MVKNYLSLLLCGCFLVISGCDSPTAPSNDTDDEPISDHIFEPEPEPQPDPEPTSVGLDIIGAIDLEGRNQELQLRAEVTLSSGQILDKTYEAQWHSSNPSVAEVNDTGLVTSMGYGVVDIRAQYDGLRTYKTITVRRVEIIFNAISAGCNVRRNGHAYCFARFERNGETLSYRGGGGGGGRGINVAAIDTSTGELLGPVRNFDTWARQRDGSAMFAMIDYLDSLPSGTLILFAVADEMGINQSPSRPCGLTGYPGTEPGVRKLESLGARKVRDYCWRGSWSFIAIKDQGAQDEQVSRNTIVTSTYTLRLP